jgi:hypothetical protein
VSYDAYAESVRHLEGAAPAGDARLSRRIRYAALVLDRADDIAATIFLRRGVSGQPLLDVHALERTGTGWRLLGGGSAPAYEAMEPRARLADLPHPGVSHGSGGTARSARGMFGANSREWISWAEVRAAQEVAALRVGDRRVPVSAHGIAVVVWTGLPPIVTAANASGTDLGRVPIRVAPYR